jgi:hypothetical protein
MDGEYVPFLHLERRRFASRVQWMDEGIEPFFLRAVNMEIVACDVVLLCLFVISHRRYRDRTSQLTALAQLMIDPHYRTTEGFLALLQKEWASFGHKFEDRLGRRGHSKEVSPVCLQFLDCVWQMLRQFPTAFEFTSAFITLLSQAMYSGLFVTFRRNSERDRLHMMRTVGPYEDMQTDDFDYAALSGYINLLLRTSNVAAMLLNAHYLPPKASQKQVNILYP